MPPTFTTETPTTPSEATPWFSLDQDCNACGWTELLGEPDPETLTPTGRLTCSKCEWDNFTQRRIAVDVEVAIQCRLVFVGTGVPPMRMGEAIKDAVFDGDLDPHEWHDNVTSVEADVRGEVEADHGVRTTYSIDNLFGAWRTIRVTEEPDLEDVESLFTTDDFEDELLDGEVA